MRKWIASSGFVSCTARCESKSLRRLKADGDPGNAELFEKLCYLAFGLLASLLHRRCVASSIADRAQRLLTRFGFEVLVTLGQQARRPPVNVGVLLVEARRKHFGGRQGETRRPGLAVEHEVLLPKLGEVDADRHITRR